MTSPLPPTLSIIDGQQYRLVPSHYPPIHLFEHLLDPAELDAAYALESLTNPRLRDEAGDIHLVAPDERVVGPGSSPIMAAFTHIGGASRFTDGSYGVYYAGLTLEVAIAETIYHRERFLSATHEKPCSITMRCYSSRLAQPLHDIRGAEWNALHDPDDYKPSQQFAKNQRTENSWGLFYRSVRKAGGECVAVFRPQALKNVRQSAHYQYRWDGERITDVLQLKRINLEK
ncbi:MAG: RES family NAD+ phosphorylase [Spongiibacteraceae bacterium]